MPVTGTTRVWETTDLGTAAFVKMSGLEILGVTKNERDRFAFRFADPVGEDYPAGRGRELAVAYANSECREFDAAVRTMKKLCYDSNPGRSRTIQRGR